MSYSTPQQLNEALREIAGVSRLLVVSDFDGTLAGYSTDMYDVTVDKQAVAALKTLTELPGTTVAILSGRHIAGLKQASGFSEEDFILVGSHGAESTEGGVELSEQQKELLELITEKLEALAGPIEGAFVEHKPYHRVLHTIAATDRAAADAACEQALALDIPGVHIKPGKNIVEVSVVDVTKGSWLAAEVERLSPDATVFLGDDTTDEDGFKVLLDHPSLTVKVGEGPTHAQLRVPAPKDVGELLSALAEMRAGAVNN